MSPILQANMPGFAPGTWSDPEVRPTGNRPATMGQDGFLGDPTGSPMTVKAFSQLNVKSYGAVGDGLTDDTTSIQAAITAAHGAGGGSVFFPGGVYVISASLQLYDGVHLWGTSSEFKDTTQGTVIRTATVGSLAGVPMINVNNTKRAGVHNLTLQPAGASPTTNTTLGISDFTNPANQAGFLVIEDCNFRYFGGVVIGLFGNVNWIMRNRADDSNSHFIHLVNSTTGPGSGSDNFVAFNESGSAAGNTAAPGALGDALRLEQNANCTIIGNHFYNFGYGIHVVTGSYHQIEGNRCEKHDFSGIQVEGPCFGNTILGNHLFNNGYVSGRNGIAIIGSGATSGRNIIEGNHIFNEPAYPGGGTAPGGVYALDGNMNVGILLSGGTTRNQVVANRIYNANTIAIQLDTTTLNAVRDNYIDTCGQQGILLGNSSNDTAVSTNTVFRAGQQTDNTYDGIAVTSTSNNNSILANTIRSGLGATQTRNGIGITAGSCNNTTVINNDLLGSGRAPYLDSGTGTIARYNRGWISENAGTATVLDTTTSIVVNHGVSFTPTVRSITVVPTNNLGVATKFWISAVGATQFTINIDVSPGAGTATFAWSVRQAL